MPAARDLARRYAEALAALRAVHDFDSWLGEHWHDRCPRPDAPPDAQTALGAAGAIAWHEGAETIFGYLPGNEGCFRIARASPLPEFLPSEDTLPARFGTDTVISAAMQGEGPSPSR
jgi:hypothetical protein